MLITRRTTLAAAVVAAVGVTSTACGGGSDDSGADGGDSAFSYRMPDRFVNWLNDLKWFPVLQQDSGVTVTLVDGGPGDKFAQQLDLALSSGKIEDAVISEAAQAEVYGPQGAFLDLAPVIDEHGPNIKKYMEATPEYASLVTNADGQIFGLATEYPKISTVTFYRADHFAAAGIINQPTNVEEYTDALRTLKGFYGGTVANYFPLSGRDDLISFQYAFRAGDDVDDSGQVHGMYETGLGSDIHSPGYLEMVQWYNLLFTEGLIDPEFVAGTNTEETWQTKVLTGRASTCKDFFTRPSWFMENGGPDNDPTFSMAVLAAFKDPQGTQLIQPANARWDLTRYFSVSAKSEKAEAIVKFLDHLYTDEGATTMHYGVEGESYSLTDGKPTYTVDFAVEGNQPVGTKVWNFLQDRLTFPAPIDNDAYYDWMDELTKTFARDYFTNYVEAYPVLKYTPDQLKERSGLVAAVKPFVTAEVSKFVSGARPLSEFDTFEREADDKGYAQITEIDQAAYDAMQS